MLTALGAERIVILIPDRYRRPERIRWLGPPRERVSSPPRVRLANGIWVVPQRKSRRLSPPEWTKQGLCAKLPVRASDPMFFGVEKREAPGTLIVAANLARQICVRCPVSAACLTAALVGGERYGIWGATSGRQRTKLRARIEEGAAVSDLVAEVLG